MNKFQKIYNILHKAYGPQGWWPIKGEYHSKTQKNKDEIFEICIGAILTHYINFGY